MTRRFVAVALAVVVATIALVVWWAVAHDSASDAGIADPRTSSSHGLEHARELEDSAEEATGSRTSAFTAELHVLPAAAASGLARDDSELVGQIRVRLIDALGRAVTGLAGTLEVERVRSTSNVSVVDPRFTASRSFPIPANGQVTLEDLALGNWLVECRAQDCRSVKTTVRLHDAGMSSEVELVLTRQRTLEVSFRTPAGESFVDALRRAHPGYVDLVRPDLREEPGRGTSGLVGFTTEKRASNDPTYWRTLRADAFETLTVSAFVADTLIARAEAPAAVDDVTLVATVATLEAALGSLTVRVVEEGSEQPIAGASVSCSAAGFSPSAQLTVADGRVEFAGLIGTKADVSVELEQHVTVARTVAITAGARTEVLVGLERGVTIAGMLRAPDGSEVAEVVYLAAFPEGANRGACVRQSPRKNGPTFTFRDLPKGHYAVYTVSAGRTPGVQTRNGLELAEPLDIAVRKGSLPLGSVYVDARRGNVSNVVLVVPPAYTKR